jgi:hypothetical protein
MLFKMRPTLECVVIVPKVYQDFNCPGLFKQEKETHLWQSYLAVVVNQSKW